MENAKSSSTWDSTRPLLLQGFTQDYAWGMNKKSIVGKFAAETTSNNCYAELWFGDHINGPASIADLPINLRELISRYPLEILGQYCLETFGPQLPFLFKILSVGSALSIQTHPDEAFAKVLHQQDPEHYRDPFPKPEIGIALTEVELLYGFRSASEVKAGLRTLPELPLLITPPEATRLLESPLDDGEFLKEAYTAIMQAPAEAIKSASLALYQRIETAVEKSPEEQWILTLKKLYPAGDVGLFSFYLLNYVCVPIGSALYIGPNIPHAYLKNELAECMAPSDNVVRAGLTNKFIDADTLLSMLDYRHQSPKFLSPEPTEGSPDSYGEFKTPSRYFQIGVITPTKSPERFATRERVELLFALDGSIDLITGHGTTTIPPGQAALIPSSIATYTITCSGTGFRVRTP